MAVSPGPGQAMCAVNGCTAISPPLNSKREGERWLRRHLKKRHGITREHLNVPTILVDANARAAEELLDPRTWTP